METALPPPPLPNVTSISSSCPADKFLQSLCNGPTASQTTETQKGMDGNMLFTIQS